MTSMFVRSISSLVFPSPEKAAVNQKFSNADEWGTIEDQNIAYCK